MGPAAWAKGGQRPPPRSSSSRAPNGNVVEAPGVEDAKSTTCVREDTLTSENPATAADPREPLRPEPVAALATAQERPDRGVVELAARIARAIEATAARAPWCELVSVAPGFAEAAAWSAIEGEMTRRR